MFYLQELLSRRDSGLGLLWLAAMLGAKSSFSKLPRRSVLTANISQLCILIAEPNEPLALRLSSNLMIGVARVYKVKQDILLTDVTTCFNTLKKAFQEIHASGSATAQLQMGQSSVRPDTVTLATDPTAAFAMDFDHLFMDWDDRTRELEDEGVDSDDEFGRPKKTRKKAKGKASSISLAEHARVDTHTLNEHNDFYVSSSLDGSYGADGFGGLGTSFSQVGLGLEDNFLEDMDIAGGIGDELAKELGVEWGLPTQLPPSDDHGNPSAPGLDFSGPDNMYNDFELSDKSAEQCNMLDPSQVDVNNPSRKRLHSELENDAPPAGGSIAPVLLPSGSCAVVNEQVAQGAAGAKRVKRARLLLDSRTELTNEELERARSSYIEGQAEIRREIAQKKAERDGMKMLEEMVLGPPRGINAPALVQFWMDNFNVQVEARSGIASVEKQTTKRSLHAEGNRVHQDDWISEIPEDRMAVNIDFGGEHANGNEYLQDEYNLDSTRLRSSEEPDVARRASRPPSIVGSNFDLGFTQGDPRSGSQRSNLFPWDNAGVSSSISGVAFGAGGSDKLSLTRADTRLRRSSSLPKGSLGVPESPLSLLPSGSHYEPEPFEFPVPTEDASGLDTQATDQSVLSLERNSFNFLEYVKMQVNAFPSATASLDFDNLAPRDTSTRHVAAAAFYHCLVLSTKDLMGVQQSESYGTIELTVK